MLKVKNLTVTSYTDCIGVQFIESNGRAVKNPSTYLDRTEALALARRLTQWAAGADDCPNGHDTYPGCTCELGEVLDDALAFAAEAFRDENNLPVSNNERWTLLALAGREVHSCATCGAEWPERDSEGQDNYCQDCSVEHGDDGVGRIVRFVCTDCCTC